MIALDQQRRGRFEILLDRVQVLRGHGAVHETGGTVRLYDSYHCSRYNVNTKRLTEAMFHAVFAELPASVIKALWDCGWKFYTFIGEGGCRFMCAWDTQSEDVKAFAEDVRRVCRDE